MNFYIGTIVISIIFQIIAQIKTTIYRANSSEEINYLDIGKYNVLNKKILDVGLLVIIGINLFMLLIPGINFFVYGYSLYKSGNKETRRRKAVNREIMFSFKKIIETYENQKSIEEAFKIDGLCEDEIKKETKLANQELGYTYITDKMYNDIKASEGAINYLKEIEQNKNLELSRKDKIKLLKEYRKEIVGGSKERIKPIEKN